MSKASELLAQAVDADGLEEKTAVSPFDLKDDSAQDVIIKFFSRISKNLVGSAVLSRADADKVLAFAKKVEKGTKLQPFFTKSRS